MHRNRTWLLDPIELRTQRNRILPIEGGDGATLSLDFTTGVLDPRLTFTRSTDATFINSSGRLQYADANYIQNSTMLNNAAGKWTQTTSGGSVTINGDGTVRFNGTSGRATWLQGVDLLTEGLPITFSFEVTSFTNTNLRTTDLFNAANGFTNQLYYYTDTNGTTHTLGAFESLPKSGTNGIGTYTVTATPTATTPRNVIFGSDCNAVGGRNGDVTITKPQLQSGVVIPRLVYVPNSSTTSAKWDSARFDHDPTTLAPRGLLIEGQSQNLFTYSENFNDTLWSKIGSTIDTTSVTGPDGVAATTRRVKENLSNDQHGLRRQFTCAANTTYTVSVFVKKGTYDSFVFELWGGASFNAKAVYSTIDGNTAPTLTFASGVNASVTKTSFPQTGWHRYTLTFTNPIASTNTDFNVLLKQSNSYVGDGTSYMDVYGFSLELGTGASSYIPTGASQGTRNADNCAITGGNFTPWFNSSVGTLLVSARTATRYVDAAGFDFPAVLTLDSNNHIGPCQWNGVVYGVVRVGGSYRINYATLASPGNNANYKAAIAYADSDFAAVANGGSIQTGSGTTVPSGLNRLALGASRSGVAGNFFGHINQIKFWPTRLPNSQLQSLTT